MSRNLFTLAALVALAGCSGVAVSQAQLASAIPAEDAGLDGAPPLAPAPPVAFAPLRGSAPDALLVAPAREDALWCDISVRRTPNGVRITPLVRAAHALSGEYSLVITKSGAGGSADISQGGPFDVERGIKQALGSSEISLERGSRFRAVLKVRADGHEVCREARS